MAGEDELWSSISEALAPVAHLEGSQDLTKVSKRIHDYFRKAAKTIAFNSRPWWELINEYADSVFGLLFQGLGDRCWLAQADFLLVLDAGVRETFPQRIVAQVPKQEFESTVLAAHDRAFEEQRYALMLWEAVQQFVPQSAGPKAKKKVNAAGVAGHQAACVSLSSGTMGDPNQVKHFVSKWIDITIAQLSKATQGDPTSALSEAVAVQIFHSLLDAGSLPIPLVVQHGPPPRGWPFVDYVVHIAYTAHDEAEAYAARQRLKMRDKGKGGGKGIGSPVGNAEENGVGGSRSRATPGMNPGDCWPDHDDLEPVLEKEELAESKRELADLSVLATTPKPEPRFVPPRRGPRAAKFAALQERAGKLVAQPKPVPHVAGLGRTKVELPGAGLGTDASGALPPAKRLRGAS